MMDEFADLRISVKLLLKKLDKLEADINNIKTEYMDARRVTESLQRHNKEPSDYIKNLTSKLFGVQESERIYIVKSSAPLSPNEDILKILELIAKSLERHVYLLAAFTLIFVTCKFFGQ
jgi:chromosome segregation ATPase